MARDIERTVVGGGLREPAKPAVKPPPIVVEAEVSNDPDLFVHDLAVAAEVPVDGGGTVTGPEPADDVDYLEPAPNPTKVTNDE